MLGTLCQEGVAELLGDARALYEQHERDAGDTILMAFRAENWTKVCKSDAGTLIPLVPLTVHMGQECLMQAGEGEACADVCI